MAEIRYGRRSRRRYRLASQGSMIAERSSGRRAEVALTGIPVTRMLAPEREKLLHMEDELHKRVIG